jgi:hypothetical protein
VADRRAHAVAVVATAVLTSFTLTSCGMGDLSGSSTCTEFMNSSTDQQDQVVNQLAQKYRKPDMATPLGRPDWNYECAQHPDMTLDQFISRVQ